MLTISISETLAMGPSAWSTWNGDADFATGSAEWCGYEQWSPPDFQQLHASYYDDAWALESGTGTGPAFWIEDKLLPETKLEEPLKLPSNSGDYKVPLTAFASPLRVPLPTPLGLGEEASALPDLPPGLEDLDLGMVWDDSSEQSGQGEETHVIPPPPGLPTSGQSESVLVAAAELRKPALLTSADSCEDNAPQGVSITTTELGKQVEWQIESFQSKLQGNNGRPLVSPPFSACGLPNLRLMVSVDTRDLAKSKGSKGKTASKGAAKKGPLIGSLKLKADCLTGGATILKFNLNVGLAKAGPFAFDFSQQAVRGLEDFGVDWLGQIDTNTGSMRVGIELLEVQQQEN